MSEPKKQHYVTECYLREFVDPNTPVGYEPYVWRFDKNGKNRRKKSPSNIFTGTDLYTIEVAGRVKNYSVEMTLSTIESKYANVFQKKIKKKLPLSEYEHIVLCTFVAITLQRTLRKKDNIEQFLDELIDHGEKIAKLHGVLSKNVENLKKYKKNAFKLSILDLLSEIVHLLFRMNVAFLCVDDSGSKFITSDDPCILFNPKLQWQRFSGPGLGQRDIEVILPLSPEIILCLSWSNFRGYIEIKKSKIEDLNRMIRAHSYKYFISHTPKTKWIWFRKYPLNLFFIIKVLKHRIKNKIQKIVLYYKYR
ncbi:MAG: DUF4238 domain-containing protein [Candidatus Hodarchaeota archaeon]